MGAPVVRIVIRLPKNINTPNNDNWGSNFNRTRNKYKNKPVRLEKKQLMI